jgi:hypothetical protein
MTKILNDFLVFACATALVTGIVLAAATLLISSAADTQNRPR